MKILSKRFLMLAALSAALMTAQTPGTVTVINYSNLDVKAPIAPGSIASAYGNFGSVTTTALASLSPMPTTLANVRLTVGGVNAPLYFVSANQVNFVVPVGAATGSVPVEVLNGTTTVARGTVNIYDFWPALATAGTETTRPAIAQNQDFGINSRTTRARRGEVIQLYATGCGLTNPRVTDGAPPAQLSRAIADVKVTISVIEVTPQFAGAHPQFPGICQINAVIPNQSFVSGQVPVLVTVNGIASNAVSIWVAE
ncbi:MAG: hypothetical protein NTX13_01875 [Acidobacteria bacterium]|nr:hypothetical protein [Acidobacteriota bacterium]